MSRFLAHAVEILDNADGNENGICANGEICLYTPNIGAYQGEGDLIPAGSFVDETLTDTTLLGHESNGVSAP